MQNSTNCNSSFARHIKDHHLKTPYSLAHTLYWSGGEKWKMSQ
uniref:Uncharacterized protein n=1 Tax=Anguilla anguilla TaxID=7936 RepID=A0A0E9QER5_ANGAN